MNFSASNNYSTKFLLIQHQSSSGTGLFCTLSCSMPAEVVDWTSTDDSNFHQLSNTDASNSGILSGTVSDGTAATHMYYSGSKTWTVTSSTNNYTGNTTISSGTTTVSGSNAIIPNSSATTITGTWDMAGYSETVGSITGAGTIDIVSAGGTSTLTTGENNTSTTFSGTIKNTTGTLSLTKTGSGTLTLTGTNTFSGDATISAGTLAIGSGSTSGSITNNIVNNSALIMNRSNTLTYAGVIAGTGTLTKLGAGTLSLTGGNTFSGDLTISAGAVSLGTGSTSGTVASNIVNNSALIVNRSNAISYGGVISGTGTLTKQAAGTLTLTNNNTYSGTTTLTDGTIEYGTSNAITASSIILNGGTLSTGSTSGYSSTTTGTLSLTNNSTINLGSGSHTLAFAASNGATWTSGKTLTINGWSGNFDGTAGTGGIIKTGSSAELSASILNQIQFFRASNSTNYPATQLANGEIVPTVVLPVLYSSFTIKKLHDINIIYWSTTIEVNNANFDIERSFDGVTFEIIGNVKGKGNTTTTTNYEFIDHKINTKKPIYYRLKQIDNDGKYAYSAIKLVKNTSVANPIKIFPNPIQGESKLYATFDDEAETVEISLYDLSGRLVQYLTINNIKPNETYELNKDNLALQKGEYILHLITSNDEYSEKIEVK
jgi:autotransporter-associated beta strand protein